MTVPETRREAHAYLKSLDASRYQGHWSVWSAVYPRRRLQIELDISGKRTTRLAMERCGGVDAPPETEAWMRDNLWPYSRAHTARTRGWNTMPSAGMYSGTYILTADLLDVLRLWVPLEIHWQDTEPPREAEPTHEATDPMRPWAPW